MYGCVNAQEPVRVLYFTAYVHSLTRDSPLEIYVFALMVTMEKCIKASVFVCLGKHSGSYNYTL